MSKTALVVDDSQVARHVLSSLLTANGITADSAESGERALDYLKHQRPDVIFMDHNKPGIDGFQALEAIKANPATATIPVMMYTSEEGELYVGQARALGAFGVLPKGLKPIELTQVLKALHLIPGNPAVERRHQSQPVAAERRVQTQLGAQAPGVAELLEELFRQQRLVLGAEIRDGYERVAASASSRDQPVEVSPPPQRAVVRPAVVAAVVLGGLAVLFAYLYVGTARLLQENTQRSSSLIASAAQLVNVNANANASSSAKPQGGAFGAAAPGAPQLVELIEWTLNEDSSYGFDEIALSEPRAEKLRRAIGYAASVGLGGLLSLRVHVGRFCMAYGSDGRAELAPPTSPMTQCEQVGWLPSDAFALGRRQTLGFANIVMGAQNGTGIRVETASVGAEEPAVPYPAVTAGLTAGEWNQVAAANHRIDIRFTEEGTAAQR
jgi:CheY-like chemotaxis protein